MQHEHFYCFKANTNYDLGLQMGTVFKDIVSSSLQARKSADWEDRIKLAQKFLSETENHFPQYIEELEGYAKGAEVAFSDIWTMSLEDELDPFLDTAEKCTFGVTNEGKLLFHNEDWSTNAKDAICVVQKTVGEVTILELYYYNTLGGCAVSINSNGYAHSINTLTHKDKQIGVPRNVIARWLSETSNPEQDFDKLQSIQRSSGYNHNIVASTGDIFNMESTATKQIITRPQSPFTHTNHYLTELATEESADEATATRTRYESSCKLVKDKMSLEQVKAASSIQDAGEKVSIFNERTIGRMIVDFESDRVFIWLRREDSMGWLAYKLE